MTQDQWRCLVKAYDGSQCGLVMNHPGEHMTQAAYEASKALAAPTPAGATTTRRYRGDYATAMGAYQRESADLAASHWYPVSQQYAPGSWGAGAWILALILCIFVLGLFVLVYMVVARPAGELVVLYQYRPASAQPDVASPAGPLAGESAAAGMVAMASDTMACPRCAETIKRAALICRFCQLDLGPRDTPWPNHE